MEANMYALTSLVTIIVKTLVDRTYCTKRRDTVVPRR
jgi:hypothetical protein